MVEASNVFGFVVAAALGLYGLAYVGMPALDEIFAYDTSAWPSGPAGMVSIIGVFFMLTAAVIFAKPAMDSIDTGNGR